MAILSTSSLVIFIVQHHPIRLYTLGENINIRHTNMSTHIHSYKHTQRLTIFFHILNFKSYLAETIHSMLNPWVYMMLNVLFLCSECTNMHSLCEYKMKSITFSFTHPTKYHIRIQTTTISLLQPGIPVFSYIFFKAEFIFTEVPTKIKESRIH